MTRNLNFYSTLRWGLKFSNLRYIFSSVNIIWKSEIWIQRIRIQQLWFTGNCLFYPKKKNFILNFWWKWWHRQYMIIWELKKVLDIQFTIIFIIMSSKEELTSIFLLKERVRRTIFGRLVTALWFNIWTLLSGQILDDRSLQGSDHVCWSVWTKVWPI